MGRIWLEKCDSRNQICDWTKIAWKMKALAQLTKRDWILIFFLFQLNPAQLANLGRQPSCYHSWYGFEEILFFKKYYFNICGVEPLLEAVLGVPVTMFQEQSWNKIQGSVRPWGPETYEATHWPQIGPFRSPWKPSSASKPLSVLALG